jgi:hypothetical protein
MADTDTEEALVAAFTALARRAIALGRRLGSQETTERILRAAGGEVATPPPLPPVRHRERPSPNGSEPPRSGRKYPYGFVTSSVEKAAKAHPNGIERDAVGPYIRDKLGRDIDDETIRNAIKQLIRTKRMHRQDDQLFWSGQ